jgi:biopolymer transport protein ExbB
MDAVIQGIQLFQKGGLVMYILLLCSIFVVYTGIERLLFFRKMDSGRRFAAAYYAHLKGGQAEAGFHLARRHQGDLARILTEALDPAIANGGAVSDFCDIQSGIAIAKLREHLYYLNIIVTMAPLLGLLGTISGMIRSFSVFNLESGQAVAITGGVGEALIATAMGLCVAILALVIHAVFMQWLDHIITDMELCFSALELRLRSYESKGSDPA